MNKLDFEISRRILQFADHGEVNSEVNMAHGSVKDMDLDELIRRWEQNKKSESADEQTLLDYFTKNPGNLFELNNKFGYEDKRFCFNCKLDAEQLLNQKKTLKTCTNCQIAQYCGIECQRKEYPSHKQWCILFVKRQRKVMDKAKKILEEKGHDVNRSALQEFYDENDVIFQCIQKKREFIYEGIMSSPLERGVIIDLGQVFHTYNNSNMNIVKSLGKFEFEEIISLLCFLNQGGLQNGGNTGF